MTTVIASRSDVVAGDRNDPLPRISYRVRLAAMVVLVTLLLAIPYAHQIAAWQMNDTDDLMRLQQVRDWLAGQGWFNVTQYRVDPPVGLPMHWSRLVDVPLAAVIVVVRLFASEATAELAACVVVPLVTFATTALLTAGITRRLQIGDRLTFLAVLFTATNFGTVSASHPMRIDHHGWQAACGLAIALALLGPRTLRRSAIAGLCAALWMHISLEGIVFTAGCGAWLGLRWIVAPDAERATLPGYMGGVAGGSFALFLIAHGGALFDRTACDAISPVHMVVFGIATAGAGVAAWLSPRSRYVRGATLAVTAIACAATYKLWAPQCSGGPFAALTPLGYNLWYRHIPEGLPLWTQSADYALTLIAFPLVGLIGALVGLRSAGRQWRSAALDYFALLALATLIGLNVSRACILANLLAVPGALMLLAAYLPRAARLRTMAGRVAANTALLLAATPLSAAVVAAEGVALVTPAQLLSNQAAPVVERNARCKSFDNLAHLDALPPTLMMTTLATAASIVAGTPHSVVGAGYHRGIQGMDDTIRFFVGDEATAHAILLRHGVRYLLLCPDDGDIAIWAKAAPHGLAARLPRGQAPAWLHPVTVPGLREMRVYAVSG